MSLKAVTPSDGSGPLSRAALPCWLPSPERTPLMPQSRSPLMAPGLPPLMPPHSLGASWPLSASRQRSGVGPYSLNAVEQRSLEICCCKRWPLTALVIASSRTPYSVEPSASIPPLSLQEQIR